MKMMSLARVSAEKNYCNSEAASICRGWQQCCRIEIMSAPMIMLTSQLETLNSVELKRTTDGIILSIYLCCRRFAARPRDYTALPEILMTKTVQKRCRGVGIGRYYLSCSCIFESIVFASFAATHDDGTAAMSGVTKRSRNAANTTIKQIRQSEMCYLMNDRNNCILFEPPVGRVT
jgi:hypothetical protein